MRGGALGRGLLRGALALRRHASGVAVERGTTGLSALARLHPLARPARHGVEVLRDISYGPDRVHRLDLYRPLVRHGPSPAVLYLHGGGFRILSKDTHWAMALVLAREGYTVFVPDYRLAPRHPFPAAIEDAGRALLWLAERASLWGADPAQTVLAGESAGANLALALAIGRSWRREEPWATAWWDAPLTLRALLPACGIYQVSEIERLGQRGVMADRLRAVSEGYLPHGAPAGRVRDLVDMLCFLEQAPPPERPLPPSFLVAGDRDPLREDSERLQRALTRAGATSELEIYPGGHAFHALLWRSSARRAWRDQHAFLRRAL